jgi:hypothetical protein
MEGEEFYQMRYSVMQTHLMQTHNVVGQQDRRHVVQHSIHCSISVGLSHHTLEMIFLSAGREKGLYSRLIKEHLSSQIDIKLVQQSESTLMFIIK